jgi:hypothetical protein
MSKTRIAPRRPAPDQSLEELLTTVETQCARAGTLMRATARVVAGDELGLQDEGGPVVFGSALEHVAGELEALGDRALKARTAGGAA